MIAPEMRGNVMTALVTAVVVAVGVEGDTGETALAPLRFTPQRVGVAV